MLRKILFGVIGAAILLIFGAVFGLIIGAMLGGNLFTEFEFAGVRGYEAAGNLGALIGAAIGTIAGAFLGAKVAGKRK